MSSWLPTLIFVPLIGFLLYRRISKTFGAQPVTPKRMIARIVLLSVLSVFFLAVMPTPIGIGSALAGAVGGALLAIYALRNTTIEARAEGKFFTADKWTGIAVTALLFGRIAARMFTVYGANAAANGAPPTMQRSPLTLGLYFLLAAYYVAYYSGILKRAKAISVPVIAREEKA